jgi:acetyl-CoA carboxylase biotin carboxyl carrier protein
MSQLESLLKLMERHTVEELEWEKGGERVSLRVPRSVAVQVPVPLVEIASRTPLTTPSVAHVVAPKPDEVSSNQKTVSSPFVGTFYIAASPNVAPYVRAGQTVKRGDVLCIIEAMKLMNEIEAEFPGKVVSCLVENGQPVEFGEPLFLIEV